MVIRFQYDVPFYVVSHKRSVIFIALVIEVAGRGVDFNDDDVP